MRITRHRGTTIKVRFGHEEEVDESHATEGIIAIDHLHVPVGIEVVQTSEFLRFNQGIVVEPPNFAELGDDADLISWDPDARRIYLTMFRIPRPHPPFRNRSVASVLLLDSDGRLCGVEVALAHWEAEQIMARVDEM